MPRPRRTVLVALGVLVLLGVAGIGVAATVRPDFRLEVAPASQSVQRGSTANYAVTASGTNGFSGSVTYTVKGLPKGATAEFAPASTSLSVGSPSGTVGLTVVTATDSPVGTYKLNVTGTSGSKKRSVTAQLIVTRPAGGFSLGAAPSTATVSPGAGAAYTVTVSRTGAFAGPVTLARYGTWPAGVSSTFSPKRIPGTGTTSTLTVGTTSGVAPGTYALQIRGAGSVNGATTYQYAQVELVVEASTRAFTISGGTPARLLSPGDANQPLDLALSNPNEQAISITNLGVAVTGTSNPACGADNYAVTQYSGPYPLSVSAGATNATLSSLGVPAGQQPQLRMLNLPTNQDACKGVTVTLSYSGAAQGG